MRIGGELITTIFRNILAKDENKKRNNLKRGEVEKD